MNPLTRGMRNAFRNSIRTVSIVIILSLSIGLALTMLIARGAVQSKIDAVKSSIGNTITISPAGARGFEGGGEPLTSDQLARVTTLDHVTSVTQTIQDRLNQDNSSLQSAIQAGSLGRRNNSTSTAPDGPPGGFGGNQRSFTPPVFVVGANTLDGPVLNGGGKVSLTSGDKFDPTTDTTLALVGHDLATKNNLSVGSTFTAYASTFTVKGVFDAGNTFSNNSVVMPLPTVQRLSDQVGQISSAIVSVDNISNVDATSTAIKSALGRAADVVSQQDSSAQALEPLENIKSISLYSLIGAVVAGAVIILLTMLMIVRERRREIGVLKAIGASNYTITMQFVTEAITFTLIAAVLGLGLGVVGGNPVTKALVSSSSNATQTQGPGGDGFGRGIARVAGLSSNNIRNVTASVGWSILLYGLAAALIIAVLGSAIPAWLISKIRPAEVMRSE